jgi:hypothetical protein
MVHPGLSTLNNGKNKKKPSALQLKAKAEHEVWQRKNGVHPDQLGQKNNQPKKLRPYLTIDRSGPQVSNGFAPGGAKKSLFDTQWQKTYEDDPYMAEREAEALKAADALKADLMPIYSKGPVMLKPKELKMTDLGKRR